MINGYSVEEIISAFDDALISEAMAKAKPGGTYECHSELERASAKLGGAQATLLGLMANALSMCHDQETIYGPYIRLANGRRAASIEDFVGEVAQVLEGVFDKISHPVIKARISDVLWVNRKITRFVKPIRFAIAALDGFASTEVAFESWFNGRECEFWSRAVKLALSLNEIGRDYLSRFEDKFLTVIRARPPFEESILVRVSEMILESGLPFNQHRDEMCQLLEDELSSLDTNTALIEATAYYEQIERWHKLANDDEAMSECIYRRAMAEKNAAELFAKNGADPAIIAARLESAQRDLDRLPRQYKEENAISEEAFGLRKSLHEAYRGMIGTMKHFRSDPVDITNEVALYRDRMHGLDAIPALVRFSSLHSVGLHELKDSVRKQIEEYPITAIFPAQTFEKDRVASRSKGIDFKAGNIEDEPRFYELLVRNFGFQLYCEWSVALWPSYLVLIDEHNLTDRDFMTMVSGSSFVPSNRRYMVARGLKAGYDRDFQTAAALLIPQIENIVRLLFKELDCETFHHDPVKELDSELGLSNLVCRDGMKKIFDEDMAFTLTYLFGQSPNLNLRNQYAHGLVDDISGYSMYDFLVWYIALRLTVAGWSDFSEKLGLLKLLTKN